MIMGTFSILKGCDDEKTIRVLFIEGIDIYRRNAK